LVGLPLLDQGRVGPGREHVGDIGRNSAGQGDLAFAVHAIAHAGTISRCSSAVFGSITVRIPNAGRNAQIWTTAIMTSQAPSGPRAAARSGAMPQAKPTTKPAVRPTLPGTSSGAQTSVAEKAEERMSPTMALIAAAQNRSREGRARVKGSAPRLDTQITAR